MATAKIGDLVLYDVEELSSILKIQEKTIRAILREGKLKGRKMARKWYVTEDNLREYFSYGETEIEASDTEEPAYDLPEERTL